MTIEKEDQHPLATMLSLFTGAGLWMFVFYFSSIPFKHNGPEDELTLVIAMRFYFRLWLIGTVLAVWIFTAPFSGKIWRIGALPAIALTVFGVFLFH